MKFTKMHGCGNDYIYVNCMEESICDRSLAAFRLSDRHFGIGADGLICIDASDVADFKMDMYNADGSQGKMCGNGIRCVGKYVYDHGLTNKTTVTIETLAGIKTLHLNVKNGAVDSVRVCMGSPILQPDLIPVRYDGEKVIEQPLEVCGEQWNITCVSMGSPHAVTFVDDAMALDLNKLGMFFEHHEKFPDSINTEFIHVLDENNIFMRVWERGSGETYACGTGACASVVAAVLCGRTNSAVTVHMKGGRLLVEWDRSENLVYMTGPAKTVFEGDVDLTLKNDTVDVISE